MTVQTTNIQPATLTRMMEVHVVDAENGVFYTPLPLDEISFLLKAARLYQDGATIEVDIQMNGVATTLVFFHGELVANGDPLI